MSGAEFFSYCVSLVSIVLAVWQTNKNANLKKYIKSDAMELYSEAGIMLGNAQSCLKKLQEGNNGTAIQEAGKSEGMSQALFQRSIKNIYHHFAFTRKDLDEWIEKKKIDEHHKDAFLKYAEK
ncbi:hypothetical protein [Desulfobacula sp.]|uniref:hypothetical protein n=1 Tax=Desulfobacula sp. TaxID=2593537 RepID=UPI0027147AC8|nr:hypothetical protein [Desulfobacula sp.]